MSEEALTITENDEAGNVIATYVQSLAGKDGLSRVDVIVRPSPIYLPTYYSLGP
jgi:hypothetical protein